MFFEKNIKLENIAKRLGFLFAYFLFATTIFLIFKLLNKTPQGWNYVHFMYVAFIISWLGSLIKKIVK